MRPLYSFFKMINEIVNKVACPCCKSVCRAGPIKKTPAKKHYETSPEGPKRGRRTRPDVYKDQVNYWVERIRQTENTSNRVTLDDVEPRHLQSRVKKRLDKQNEGKKDSNVT